MQRMFAIAITLFVLGGMTGCGQKTLPSDLPPAKNLSELQSRYDAMWVGIAITDAASYLRKDGVSLTGFSSELVARKPKGNRPPTLAADTELYWISEDQAAAIYIVFGPNDRAKQIQLLQLTPSDAQSGR